MATTTLHPTGAGLKPLNLWNAEFRANPYPTYARLRKSQPVVPVRTLVGQSWLITRYEDVVNVLKDPRFSNSGRKHSNENSTGMPRWLPRIFRTLANSMITSDDPDHQRLRNLVHQAFTPRRVEQMTARIEQMADELLAKAARKKVVDIVADYALPIPLTIISEMMGVPEKNRLEFHKRFAQFLETPSSGLVRMITQIPNGYRMMGFFESLIQLRKSDPQDDLITALVNSEQSGDRLNESELLAMIFLLLLAGHETTVNLIANGTLALLEHPDQMKLLHQNPGLIESAVEELLRFTNPVEYGATRFPQEDVEMHGLVIPRGSRVLAMLSSANRDETVFENPDTLDLARQPNRHLAFGLGIHYCLGAPLARLEGKIALNALVQRFPDLRLAVTPKQIRWRSALAVRGVKALPVRIPG
jgi:cytochrome P450